MRGNEKNREGSREKERGVKGGGRKRGWKEGGKAILRRLCRYLIYTIAIKKPLCKHTFCPELLIA